MRRIILGTMIATVLVAGCSGSPAPTSTDPVGGAAPETPTLQTYATLPELTTAIGEQARADETARQTISTVTTGSIPFELSGEGVVRYGASDVSTQLDMSIAAGGQAPVTIGIIALPGETFLMLPPGATGSADKPWFRIDPAGGDPISAQFAPIAKQIQDSADPTKSFGQFGDAAMITGTAEDQVDGVDTVRYTLVVDLAAAAAAATDPTTKQQLEQGVAAGVTETGIMIWLDAQDRALKTEVTTEIPGTGSLTIEIRTSDFGEPVDIAAPPVDQIANG